MTTSTTTDVRRFVLDNGLRVLIKPVHSAPVAAVLAHVDIGYFNEPDHWNGIAHVVEHMFFKGTRTRPGKEQIAEDVRALGGSINAGTYYEETSYYIVAPSANVDKAIEIQADCFTGSLFDGDELAKELEVIIQESKQKRDNPGAMLLETMYATAFDRHRIRRWRIGPDDVLRALRSEDLHAFVGQTYRPENIVLTVVGDVDVESTLAAVRRHWDVMPRGELVKERSEPEPERTGFRYHRMRGEIRQRLLEIGLPAPDVLHADVPALIMLGSLLSDGRSARLYRALKEEAQLVNSAWAGYEGFSELGVFTLGAETIGDDPLPAARALFEQAARVANGPVAAEELDRIKTRVLARRLYAQEEVLGMARTLAEFESLGDYHLGDELTGSLEAVTAADLQRVAARYLDPARATMVEYLPGDIELPERGEQEVFDALRSVWRVPEPVEAEAPATRAVQERGLPRGATLLFRERRDLPIVAMHLLLPGGKAAETAANAGITSLMLKSSLKGTAEWDGPALAEAVERLGSSIGLPLVPDYFGYSLKIPADRLREGLALLAQVIAAPTFPAEEVEKEKQSIYGEIRRQQDSMFSNALDQFNHACYGDHPYGLPSVGRREAVESLTPDDLRAWHHRWVRSGQAVWSVVGDVDVETIAELLNGILPEGAPEGAEAPDPRYASPGNAVVAIPRQQTASVMGFPGASMQSDDRHALDVLAEVTSGLAGRFFQAVRGDNGLAYAVTSFHRARRGTGNFITYTATSPANEELAREIILKECDRLVREPIGEKELADAKEAIRGEHAIGTQTFSAQAAESAALKLCGLTPDGAAAYLARIESLTAEEIRRVAGRYLRRDAMWIGAVRGE